MAIDFQWQLQITFTPWRVASCTSCDGEQKTIG
jgi:hypothetical protein